MIKDKKHVELTDAEKIQADCDLKATNVILQGLPPDVYALVNHHRVAKDLWERVQLLMQGTSLTKQERECKLYDEFDKFARIKKETLNQYYLRFAQLINDMNVYKMTLQQFQVNTKFLNSLLSEWSKFVTDVKLVRDLYTTNFDQLHAYLEQHEIHANELSYNTPQFQYQYSPPQSTYRASQPSQHYSTSHPSAPLAITYHLASNQVTYPQPPSLPHVAQQTPQAEFPQLDSHLAVPVFMLGDDPLNKMMSFLSTVISTLFPSTKNHLRTSSNPKQQATIQDGRGMGKMARQCTQPKRKRDALWFRDKVLLVEAQGKGQVLDEEELAFLADPGVVEAKAIFMANLSNYGSDVLFEVPQPDNSQSDMNNQIVQTE
ncbi:hypothetical protein Tco_1413367 [Tanacetum coccineum]